MNGLLVGRFQPFHLGHIKAIEGALTLCDNLWLCIGSTNAKRSIKNPFSAKERRQMMEASIDLELAKRIRICEVPDVDDHKKWLEKLDSIVPPYGIVVTKDKVLEHLYSHREEKTVDVPFADRENLLGTNIRSLILSGGEWRKLVPKGTAMVLDSINATDRLKGMV